MGVRRWFRGPASVRADDVVVLDADGYRLGVAEPVGGGVAPAAGVVGVQAAGRVEPQQPAQIGQLRIDLRPSRRSKVDSIRPVKPAAASTDFSWLSEIPLSQ